MLLVVCVGRSRCSPHMLCNVDFTCDSEFSAKAMQILLIVHQGRVLMDISDSRLQ